MDINWCGDVDIATTHLTVVGSTILKNQFFGDKHDYFKYDLWLEVSEKLVGIKRLTFIPMLTPNDSTTEGGKTKYQAGKRRRRRYGFLQFCQVPNRRSLKRLREFLCDERFEYLPYRDQEDCGYQDGSWDAYFNAIPHEWLKDSVVLVDPDTGLEPDGKSTDKHVSYSSVVSLINKCAGNWVVLLVQFTLRGNAHGRRARLDGQHHRLQTELREARIDTGGSLWVAEKTRNGFPGEIAMFAVGARGQPSRVLNVFINRYARKHSLLVGWV